MDVETTRRELEEVSAAIVAYRESGKPRVAVEFKRLCMRKAYLTRQSRGGGGLPALTPLEREARKREREARAQRRVAEVLAGFSPAQVEKMRELVMQGADDYIATLFADMQLKSGAGRGLTRKEANRLREKAQERYHDLLKLFAGKQVDREPKRSTEPRTVVFRDWPQGGATS